MAKKPGSRASAASTFRAALVSAGIKPRALTERRVEELWTQFGGVYEGLGGLWRVHDRDGVTFDDYEYLPAAAALGEWQAMKKARDEFFATPWTGPVDAGVRPLFWHDDWKPFARDGRGGLVCVDLAPTEQGNGGQVIFVGRDPDLRVVLEFSLRVWIAEVTIKAAP